jgi:WD40 repeat protein
MRPLVRSTIHSWASAGLVKTVVYSPDGRWLATASFDHTVAIWDTAMGKLLHRLKGHNDRVDGVAFSPAA